MALITSKKSLEQGQNYLPDPKKSKIAVAMSGGVDSSAALAILKNLGYDVVGITAWIISGSGRCCDNGVVDAVKVCDQLGVEHHAIDLRKEFADGIIRDFHESYARGETPIPCISCNNDVKWGSLLAYSIEKLGATHLASGHYAKLGKQADDSFTMLRPKETNKDQSYMLWGLTQDQLAKTVFPLADLDKDEVRKIAEENNLCVANKPESQDICFVSNGMTNSDYLTKILGEKPGEIIEIESGEVLGKHKGSFNYTYGQRKGLGIAYPEPLYVVKTDPLTNKVYVGTRDKIKGQKAFAKDRNIISKIDGDSFMSLVKIRYNMEAVPAMVKLIGETELEVDFIDPIDAITPGQAIALYDRETGQELIGGAWIVGEERK
ncbi:MAG: tRNA 2-thiouridine(34) synthase MnmA [Cyanobacteria bacterium]|nr:tRNA 2-thiouridine(34) synthase MnmA [Cyanobacteriota bacterium]MDA1020667.1 tRNA 2-thiouridine(34) synthase MnmA [Cyanobacteriota bacterium]